MLFTAAASRLARVLFTPRRVFEEQRDRPTWFVPWLVIALVLVVIGLINLPYANRMIVLEMAARGTPVSSQPEWVLTATRAATIAGQPLTVLVAALLSAAVMWPVLKVAGHGARFRALLCAATFANAATVVQAALIALAFRLRGSPEAAIRNVRDVRVSVSADLLVPDTVAPFVRAVLAGIGPMEIWAVVVMAVGVKTLEKPRHGAWAAAITAYVVLLMLAGLTA